MIAPSTTVHVDSSWNRNTKTKRNLFAMAIETCIEWNGSGLRRQEGRPTAEDESFHGNIRLNGEAVRQTRAACGLRRRVGRGRRRRCAPPCGRGRCGRGAAPAVWRRRATTPVRARWPPCRRRAPARRAAAAAPSPAASRIPYSPPASPPGDR